MSASLAVKSMKDTFNSVQFKGSHRGDDTLSQQVRHFTGQASKTGIEWMKDATRFRQIEIPSQ